MLNLIDYNEDIIIDKFKKEKISNNISYNLLVDGSNLFLRCNLSKDFESKNKGGESNSTLKKFMNSLFFHIRNISNKCEMRISRFFVVFDKGGSIRHRELLPTYKNKGINLFGGLDYNEKDAIERQLYVINKILGLIPHFYLFNIPFAEGDIVLSFILIKYLLKFKNIIMSGDKDYFQLLTYYPSTLSYLLHNKGGTFYDLFTFNNVLNLDIKISPKEYLLFKILVGDPSDNIPGIPNIGKKRAIEIITEIQKNPNISSNLDNLSTYISNLSYIKLDKNEIYSVIDRNFKLMNLVNFDLLSETQKKEIHECLLISKQKNKDKENFSKNFEELLKILEYENIPLNTENYMYFKKLFFL